ncbi:MAG TPA: YHS domain-containing protein [Desulfobacteraceae bacterium]|nr:YHS domain-containing protein [Desulfobacteraceae bacterium]
MFVIRFVALAILLYIGWVLLRSIAGGTKTPTAGKKSSATATPGGGDGSKVQDVLVEDPVCHTLVPKNQAVRLRKNGKTYYFCSEKCCDAFSETSRGDK